ncbi:uncharacterized protein LOC124204323 [Daphnia pulex]|uniref:uncharacterized protein LOC124204323 n=1 Tax=Daphnia pulex TaxID=6669 RepID=UPI001EDFDB72|nr:uncharacterized protein LOC124204323 [Daphnia pulex]
MATVRIHFHFLVLTCLSLWTGAVFSLEDQSSQQLRNNHNQFQTFMEATVSRLEALEQEQIKIKEDSAAKIMQLEAKVKQQEILLAALLKSDQSSSGSKSVPGESRAATKAMPTSCADLKSTGHLWSGVYSVIGASTVETVYCDFTKPNTDPGFQTFVGYAGVQSKPTYFYGQLNYNWYSVGIPIAYDTFVLNEGGAYDRTTKKFTAPVAGRYFFSFTGRAQSYNPPSDFTLDVTLKKNGATIARAAADDGANSETLSLQSILNLTAGDQVWTEVTYITSGISLLGPDYTHFTGFLLEEDVSLSLKALI